MRLKRIALLLAILCVPLSMWAEWDPPRPDRLVNDYSGILAPSQLNELETRLVELDDSTSNQVVVILTPTLGGDEIKAVGQRIGEKWGVGRSDVSNGLIVIIKSKTNEEPYGDVAIVTGYGLEGALPDVFCKHIIDDKMIPHLAEGEYYEALVEALNVIEPVVKGEYDYERYRDDNKDYSHLIGLGFSFLLFIVIILAAFSKYKKHGGGSGGGHSGGYSSRPTSWSSWGGSSLGGGSFHSGGFGGFGGGHFGGGGASGRF